MTLKMSIWKILTLSILIMFLNTACTQDNAPQTDLKSNSYSSKGFTINLPENWEVIDDHKFSSTGRSITVITHIGSMMNVDIYKNADEVTPVLPLNQYLKKYVMAALPSQQSRDAAKIEYGEIDLGSISGMYTDILIRKPENLKIFIEVYRYEIEPFIAYFTFNTPTAEQGNIKEFIEATIRSVKINADLYNQR